ncbi:MAG: DUF4249 family protein [Gemmatimonadota bacterium]|nr:DUF4249 family protein [Gemmatimonadota bacterium]
MVSRNTNIVLTVASCLLISACHAERTPESLFGPDAAGKLVLDGLLIVGRPLPPVFVTQTVATGDRESPRHAVVSDAVVEIRQADRVFRYIRDPDAGPFQYSPPADPPVVAPETEYVMVVTANDTTARATTVTPGAFRVREGVVLDQKTEEVSRKLKTFAEAEDGVFRVPENRVVYKTGFLEARFDPIDVPGYQVGIASLDADGEEVAREISEESPERTGSSPAIESTEGSVRLPWFAIYYTGRHLMRIYAVDRNWYDFVRSGPEAQESWYGGLAGENFRRPLFNVEGGIGLFGSASVDSLGFVIVEEP